LSAYAIQKFQLSNFTTDRIVVSATGIENHQEFVDLVSEKLHYTQLGSTKPHREASKYTGGEVRNLIDSSNVHVAFAFEGASYKNAYTLLVAAEVLGRKFILTKMKENQPIPAEIFWTKMFSLMMFNLSQQASRTQDSLVSSWQVPHHMYCFTN
jgi:predicted Zn-dependent peptidase